MSIFIDVIPWSPFLTNSHEITLAETCVGNLDPNFIILERLEFEGILSGIASFLQESIGNGVSGLLGGDLVNSERMRR